VQLADGRPATPQERELFDAITLRHTSRTSRAPFSGHPIPGPARARLEQEARREFALLRLLSANDATVVLELAAAASRTLAAHFDHRAELGHWTGITGDDGIPARALGSRPDRQPAPVRDFSYASSAVAVPAATFEQQPQLAVLSTARDEPADWLRAGQALQRVLLTATTGGVATSFLYQPIELHDIEQPADDWWPWRNAPDHHPARLRATRSRLTPPGSDRDPRPAGRSRRPHPALAAHAAARLLPQAACDPTAVAPPETTSPHGPASREQTADPKRIL
jgi:hypothetical protein